jgi:hypothetical protein
MGSFAARETVSKYLSPEEVVRMKKLFLASVKNDKVQKPARDKYLRFIRKLAGNQRVVLHQMENQLPSETNFQVSFLGPRKIQDGFGDVLFHR